MIKRRTWGALALMLAASAGAWSLTPRKRRADVLGPWDLETAVPLAFGRWKIDRSAPAQIVDPQTQATIAATYTQTLSRMYVNDSGARIMIALAYGAELTDTGVGLHYPEVCYPAQGFKVHTSEPVLLEFPQGQIRARQLTTSYAQSRNEPVLYWTMIGDRSEYSGLSRKLLEIRSGLQGLKVDGLLFRVSSIDRDNARAFALQRAFITELLPALSTIARLRLTGL